jgi:hypothetical protein
MFPEFGVFSPRNCIWGSYNYDTQKLWFELISTMRDKHYVTNSRLNMVNFIQELAQESLVRLCNE